MALSRINADSIADGTVIASDIADGTITLAKLQSGLLPSATSNSAASYANSAFAAANTGTSAASYANSAFLRANTPSATANSAASYANSAFSSANTSIITGDRIGLNAINANNIVNASITGDKIGVGQITSNLFAAGAISTSNISSGNSNVSVTSANGNVTVATNNAERMRITTTGYVGIGATNPAAYLDVGSSVTQSGASPINIYSDLRINAASTGIASILNPRVVGLAGSYTIAGAAAINIAPFVMQSGVTATNTYGVYIGDVGDGGAGGTVTNKYGIYQSASSNQNYFAGTLQFNNGYGSVATAYGCRAWVNFNGTGTVAIRGSGNISSITDNGTGDYTFNFTNAMPDTNYTACSSNHGQNDHLFLGGVVTYSTASVRVYYGDTGRPGVYGMSRQDAENYGLAVFR